MQGHCETTRPKTTSGREDWSLLRLVRRVTLSPVQLHLGANQVPTDDSVQTVRSRHKVAKYRARRLLKRPEFTDRDIPELLM